MFTDITRIKTSLKLCRSSFLAYLQETEKFIIDEKKVELLVKLDTELMEYRSCLISSNLTSAEIVDKADEITVKQLLSDAVYSLVETESLLGIVADSLETEENILDYLYMLWLGCDYTLASELAEAIHGCICRDKETDGNE